MHTNAERFYHTFFRWLISSKQRERRISISLLKWLLTSLCHFTANLLLNTMLSLSIYLSLSFSLSLNQDSIVCSEYLVLWSSHRLVSLDLLSSSASAVFKWLTITPCLPLSLSLFIRSLFCTPVSHLWDLTSVNAKHTLQNAPSIHILKKQRECQAEKKPAADCITTGWI